MPIISQFYGIIVKIFFNDKDKHHTQHVHIEYGDYEASFDFDSNIIAGSLPNKQRKMVEAWVLMHQDELKSLWKVINETGEYFKIDPLR